MTLVADANAVLAFLLPDRPSERAIVAAWVEEHGPLLITEGVLAEVCWVLGKGYAKRPEETAAHLRRLIASSSFDVWDVGLVTDALDLMERHPRIGVVDSLLAGRASRGDIVVTFDRRLAGLIERL